MKKADMKYTKIENGWEGNKWVGREGERCKKWRGETEIMKFIIFFLQKKKIGDQKLTNQKVRKLHLGFKPLLVEGRQISRSLIGQFWTRDRNLVK